MKQSAKTAQDAPKSLSSSVVSSHDLEDNFSSPTPVKTKEPLRIKSNEELVELPEKYGNLLEFFDRMISSLRLLSLRKRKPAFRNVSRQVEILTGRKFLSIHLAQIKYLLPEAVQIEKILMHDEKTKCMKPDMKIELLFDIVKDHEEVSVFVALSNIFSSRLREFYKSHSEGCDVPEAALPEPFSHRTITIKEDSKSNDLLTLCETETLNPSHLPPSFKKHFHQKPTAMEMEKTDIRSPIKSDCKVNGGIESLSLPPVTSSTASVNESTPVKLSTESDSVIVETPVQATPMRSISPSKILLTCEDESKSAVSQNGKQSTSAVKKSLDFYTVDDENIIFSHKQVSVCLSDLVVLIHQIFQSVNFCLITKEELVQKIIMNNLELDDHSEVETQMENLEKMVPDWICKKLASTGDLMYSVTKVSDVNAVCERVNVI